MGMSNCNSPDLFASPDDDVFWVESPTDPADGTGDERIFSIGDLARKFDVSLRTLRFYDAYARPSRP